MRIPPPNRIARTSDWRCWRVSICLAVLASNSREIVCITDEKVSFSGFSADHMSIKTEPGFGWSAILYAGDDTQYVPLIFESARRLLKGSGYPHPRRVADAVDEAYHEQIAELIEKRVLRRFGFNTETFRKDGKRLCTADAYNRLCERIDKVRISLQFMVCGFDDEGVGHIYTAGGDRSVEGYDHVGLWAIGEGADVALASLSFHITNEDLRPPYAPLDKTLTAALSAKFMSESANTVGQGTFVVVHKKEQDVQFMSSESVEELRKAWMTDGAPRLSRTLRNTVCTCLYRITHSENGKDGEPKQLDAQTSEGQP